MLIVSEDDLLITVKKDRGNNGIPVFKIVVKMVKKGVPMMLSFTFTGSIVASGCWLSIFLRIIRMPILQRQP